MQVNLRRAAVFFGCVLFYGVLSIVAVLLPLRGNILNIGAARVVGVFFSFVAVVAVCCRFYKLC